MTAPVVTTVSKVRHLDVAFQIAARRIVDKITDNIDFIWIFMTATRWC
jgi:hypothetical protein